jgi:dCMP deaminase
VEKVAEMGQSVLAGDDAKQHRRDRYYMEVAVAVRGHVNDADNDQPEDKRSYGANCYGSKIGAVLVLEDRIIGTGYNGTPAGFQNCMDDGCIRCKDRWLEKNDREDEMSNPAHVAGAALDRCICVHAEQNALLSAARFGIRVDSATLYTTLSPCFGCLKESVQAGVSRIVYQDEYDAKYAPDLQEQYERLGAQLDDFGSLDPAAPKTDDGGPDPFHGA